MAKTKVVVVKAQQEAKNAEAKGEEELEDAIHWKHYAQLLHKELVHSKDLQVKAQSTKRRKTDKPPSERQLRSRKDFKLKVAQAKEMHEASKKAFAEGLGPKKQWKVCMAEVYEKKESSA